MTETPLKVDFITGAVDYRRRHGGGRGQPLPRALGFRPGVTPAVVDATAGLGRDAFLLASLGAKVTLIERNETVHGLLRTAMEIAAQESDIHHEIISRMTLLKGDARDILAELTPETVLIDPMHPPRGKSALVKSEMRQLRAIVGTDPDCADLMKIALAVATKRVVLKWPRRAEPMPGLRAPSHQIVGKSTRYDVFMMLPAPPDQS
ncbi:MAG: 16S rRNA methyltransferase [Sneathiella sp.]|mgnify:CR=1 FL=1|jgi:16S rRNA (guanine1516-N2)-methyltransferase|uniref:class I SAM-dependent methyltransferase n=1 Tax=Sneathiella sp. TaxID=1964365 RepID=UPI000C627B80|nr:class I SAM-dependent methyltransferase [Sneathiella sp.]MAL78529.1 16S rRNA methyltransferase [Sneathiella sp.]